LQALRGALDGRAEERNFGTPVLRRLAGALLRSGLCWARLALVAWIGITGWVKLRAALARRST
jgi:hypothetical protein